MTDPAEWPETHVAVRPGLHPETGPMVRVDFPPPNGYVMELSAEHAIMLGSALIRSAGSATSLDAVYRWARSIGHDEPTARTMLDMMMAEWQP